MNKEILLRRVLPFLILITIAISGLTFEVGKSDSGRVLGLSRFLPANPGDWTFHPVRTALKEGDEEFLNELFEGLYRDSNGSEVVLTIEYGSDVRRKYELHLPDICHRARGDVVLIFPAETVTLKDGRTISAALLEWEYPRAGTQALCAYWLVIGGEQTASVLRLKFKQMIAGWLNESPDNLLFRMDVFYGKDSTEKNREISKKLLERFIQDLYVSLEQNQRDLLFGQKPE